MIKNASSEANMSFIFEILIPKKELSKLENVNINEVLVEWAGEIYSQEPIN